jgi:hypothetical protein
MPGGLTDLVLALLHAVVGPRNCRHGRRGGRRHRRPILAPAPPPPPLPSVVSHRCVLERPLSPSLDRSTYRPMEPSDPDASPWGHWGRPCAVHGPSSSGRQGEEEGGEEEDDECHITSVTGPIGVSVIHRTTHISVGPRGRPQGTLAPQTETTPPTSPTLAAPPPPPPALPSPEADPSGSGTPQDLLSLCGNRVLRWFARFAAPSGKGRAPGSWDSTARSSH